MGQVVIELPQNVNRFYQVESVELGEEILQDLDEMELKMKSVETPAIVPPRRNNLKKDLAEAFGIWKDRPETGEEISQKIRDRNNGKI
jgi:hypothetical protein